MIDHPGVDQAIELITTALAGGLDYDKGLPDIQLAPDEAAATLTALASLAALAMSEWADELQRDPLEYWQEFIVRVLKAPNEVQ